MPRFLQPDVNLPIESVRQHVDALSIPAARDLTADEAKEGTLRELAKRNWLLGLNLTQLSQLLDVATARLSEWRKADKWPPAEEVKAQIKETQKDKVRRRREEIQLGHLERQEKMLVDQYARIEEADLNVPLSRDPAMAKVNVIKAAATVTKQFIELSGLKEAAPAAHGPRSGINLNFLTGGGPKPVAIEAGPAPYEPQGDMQK